MAADACSKSRSSAACPSPPPITISAGLSTIDAPRHRLTERVGGFVDHAQRQRIARARRVEDGAGGRLGGCERALRVLRQMLCAPGEQALCPKRTSRRSRDCRSCRRARADRATCDRLPSRSRSPPLISRPSADRAAAQARPDGEVDEIVARRVPRRKSARRRSPAFTSFCAQTGTSRASSLAHFGDQRHVAPAEIDRVEHHAIDDRAGRADADPGDLSSA